MSKRVAWLKITIFEHFPMVLPRVLNDFLSIFLAATDGGGDGTGRGGPRERALLRARRLRAAAEDAAEAGMSEDDRAAAEAQRAMERLEAFP